MAKKKKNIENVEGEEKAGSKLVVALVAILIVLIWLAIFALCVRWDVGGFGSTVLEPVLKDVPVLNKILPDTQTESLIVDEDYPYATLNEAVSRIKELENQLKASQESEAASATKITELQAEVDRLKMYENNQVEFENLKAEFYENVVYSDKAPEIEEYRKYYEEIEPEKAADLYRQVINSEQASEEVQEYAKAYSSMKEDEAAKIFEAMTDDLELAAEILNAMGSDSRGAILGAMDPDVAAQITKIMEP